MTEQTLIFGHRGFPAKYAENSLEGFHYAIEHHIDGLEFDVHLTKDNIPVVLHDETVDRTTNEKGEIRSFSLSELRELKLENGESIPTLKEVLELVGTSPVQLNIELKTDKMNYPGIEKIVLDMVKSYDLDKPVVYSSFNLDTLKRCKKIDDSQLYCWLTMHKVPEAALFVKKLGLSGLHLHHYQKDDILQRIWTVNDSFKIKKLFSQQVAGIITDNFEKAFKIREKML
ncbi:glycerophosphodiester phosphodiesterase [Liquorilactobacillus mali]|uniref:Glycerophosphoryl diester phosphodiesterase n=2 Tax=Liquorilactobacillus mali TaxID=1618 RepID=J1F0K4_9LACO|nr:glycerophosphodiester phosphodiesterase family protein [Liquorilactobacillus mali]EJE97546.1 glycerophosphoryl diester phosphodiesterase [Liquorilactobacillus mali KCTC 3596 = DSM 20444]KRN11210.1 glycerophosphoryl diester phosphodiesterase [Liquorilactobacillus mali KCTC 3596 = DSM 20444]KRN27380.1 glycerophosphoryl diester phosphodiesterase [Liquorilactobacillus mali]MDN7146325.1 glycerophosphodiester phosphodiesterase family protein [Liquorilactobacillus mali]QFQ73797.1 glycerophosphodie